MHLTGTIGCAMALLLMAAAAGAQTLYVFPRDGQSQEQTEKDKFACHSWAVEQTGFDPVNAAPAAPAGGASAAAVIEEPLLDCDRYNAGRGAVGGALGGYVTGKVVGGKQSTATQLGAVTGAMGGAAKREQCEAENRARTQRNAQRRALAREPAGAGQPAARSGSRDDYQRAYSACLDAKGYTVK